MWPIYHSLIFPWNWLKKKQNQTLKITNKHRSHQEKSPTTFSPVEAIGKLVLRAHALSQRRNSEQDTSPVEIYLHYTNSGSSWMRCSETPIWINGVEIHWYINAAWDISEANAVWPNFTQGQPGWGQRGPLEVARSNPPAQMLSTKHKRNGILWDRKANLHVNNDEIIRNS